jgi:hypothetical protein
MAFATLEAAMDRTGPVLRFAMKIAANALTRLRAIDANGLRLTLEAHPRDSALIGVDIHINGMTKLILSDTARTCTDIAIPRGRPHESGDRLDQGG